MHIYLKQDLTTAVHNCAPGQCSLKHHKVRLFLIDCLYYVTDEAVMQLIVLKYHINGPVTPTAWVITHNLSDFR